MLTCYSRVVLRWNCQVFSREITQWAKFRFDVRAVQYSHRFPHELQACGSLLFIASSPCIKAIHLPSRSKEMEIRFTRHQLRRS